MESHRFSIFSLGILYIGLLDTILAIENRFAFSNYRRDRILDVPPILTKQHFSAVRCLTLCYQTNGCKSFNFGDVTCSLLSKTLCSESDSVLKPKTGFNYYDVTETREPGDRYGITECTSDGKCSDMCGPVPTSTTEVVTTTEKTTAEMITTTTTDPTTTTEEITTTIVPITTTTESATTTKEVTTTVPTTTTTDPTTTTQEITTTIVPITTTTESGTTTKEVTTTIVPITTTSELATTTKEVTTTIVPIPTTTESTTTTKEVTTTVPTTMTTELTTTTTVEVAATSTLTTPLTTVSFPPADYTFPEDYLIYDTSKLTANCPNGLATVRTEADFDLLVTKAAASSSQWAPRYIGMRCENLKCIHIVDGTEITLPNHVWANGAPHITGNSTTKAVNYEPGVSKLKTDFADTEWNLRACNK